MKALRILIYSNLVVGISVGLLTFSCAHQIGTEHPAGLGVIAFCSTFFIYNIQRILRLKEINSQSSFRLLWIKRNVLKLLLFSVLSLIACILLYFIVLGWSVDFWFLVGCAVFGIFYAFEFTHKLRGLRDLPYIKIYLIAILWALVTVLWPYIRVIDVAKFPLWLLISVFFYILACTVPFDIRDMYFDSINKRTIPQIAGQRGAKLAACIFLGISIYALSNLSETLFHNVWFYLAYLGLGIFILWSNDKRPEMYFSGILDAWIIFYAILILFL